MALAALLLALTGLVRAFGMGTLVAWVRTGGTVFRPQGHRRRSGGLVGQRP